MMFKGNPTGWKAILGAVVIVAILHIDSGQADEVITANYEVSEYRR